MPRNVLQQPFQVAPPSPGSRDDVGPLQGQVGWGRRSLLAFLLSTGGWGGGGEPRLQRKAGRRGRIGVQPAEAESGVGCQRMGGFLRYCPPICFKWLQLPWGGGHRDKVGAKLCLWHASRAGQRLWEKGIRALLPQEGFPCSVHGRSWAGTGQAGLVAGQKAGVTWVSPLSFPGCGGLGRQSLPSVRWASPPARPSAFPLQSQRPYQSGGRGRDMVPHLLSLAGRSGQLPSAASAGAGKDNSAAKRPSLRLLPSEQGRREAA